MTKRKKSTTNKPKIDKVDKEEKPNFDFDIQEMAQVVSQALNQKREATKKQEREFKVVAQDETSQKETEWEGKEIMVESQTKLEEDRGTGSPIIIRFFEFGVNPEAFQKYPIDPQGLFNSHARGIQQLLWRDGLVPIEEIPPKLLFSKNRTHYRIIITCKPRAGAVLLDKTMTLGEITQLSRNDNRRD